jgi:predicted RNA-binding Zn-ribbon protein involved in translation (DUF1610 family)
MGGEKEMQMNDLPSSGHILSREEGIVYSCDDCGKSQIESSIWEINYENGKTKHLCSSCNVIPDFAHVPSNVYADIKLDKGYIRGYMIVRKNV